MENLIGDPEVNSGQNAGAKLTMLVEQWESENGCENFFGVDLFDTILLVMPSLFYFF